jgi:adenylosuccinate lyase
MAHIHAFGDLCPEAKPIIHWGATSCYVTDNADLLQMREALHLLFGKMLHVIQLLSHFAKEQKKTPALSYTHFQSAQPTTFGKRATLWLQDFWMDALEWERMLASFPFLGAKGATGTQSSFLFLFDGHEDKIDQLETLIAAEFGLHTVLPISGQTYTRKIDLHLLNAFESFAASAHKMATDLRLLAHDGELVEGFEKNQVGSSAMPYKRNPIYSERICGIARFVISLAQNPAYTTATQWLERSLDDSSNRRLSLPDAFLGVDAILNLLIHLIPKLQVNAPLALRNIEEKLPFLVMENILMASVKKGGNRQELHEKLRLLSEQGSLSALVHKIEQDPSFHLKKEEINKLTQVSSLIGLAPSQVDHFLTEVELLLKRHPTPPKPSHSVDI